MATGCGGLPAQGGGGEPDTATVVVTIGPAGTQEALDVEAVVICGGVRTTYRPADGWATLENVPFGDETPPRQPLTVTAKGYRTASQWVTLSVGSTTFVDVELVPVDLAETGTVEGRVTDQQSGQPIANASVKFEGPGDVEVEGFTDAQGNFVIGGIPAGPNNVTVGAAGYLVWTGNVDIVADEAGENPPLEVQLLSGSATIPVRGTVVDIATGAPIEGATVTIADQTTTTEADGTFAFAGILVGEHEITVTADGYEEYHDTVNVMPGMGQVRVELVGSAPNPPPPPHNITGTVEVRNRPDNSGAVVSAYNLRLGMVMDEYTTGPDGRYYLFVPPGDYELRVTYDGQQLTRRITVPGGGRVVTGIDFVISAPPR